MPGHRECVANDLFTIIVVKEQKTQDEQHGVANVVILIACIVGNESHNKTRKTFQIHKSVGKIAPLYAKQVQDNACDNHHYQCNAQAVLYRVHHFLVVFRYAFFCYFFSADLFIAKPRSLRKDKLKKSHATHRHMKNQGSCLQSIKYLLISLGPDSLAADSFPREIHELS